VAAYAYDDFRITLTARADGRYDLLAQMPRGREHRSVFDVPLTIEQLEGEISGLAGRHDRSASSDGATREVSPAEELAAATNSAERLGLALARALFSDGVGEVFDAAREASEENLRGLRLTLSLAGAPALLSVPWEFLYRPPRFLASQRRTPLVRQLDSGVDTAPPQITDIVRILGVIASPTDLPPLDVDAERSRVDKAVAKMVAAGLVKLDWVEPASPRSVREALRDQSYHIVHYVGHSSFTTTDEGAIYLQDDDDGHALAVDNTMLANLVADQPNLRLAVINSCDGARTTLHDPYAGVATTLIQLGVPAVVAMQFAISDDAAILFADEFYTNLIGRQDPIDAAVSEARKAIYVEIDRVEWATPVLFVRDPDVQLFDFKVAPAALPPLAPPEMGRKKAVDTSSEGATPPPTDPLPARPNWYSHPVVIGCLLVLASLVAFAVPLIGGYRDQSLSLADVVVEGELGTPMTFTRGDVTAGEYTVYVDNSGDATAARADDVSCDIRDAGEPLKIDGSTYSARPDSDHRQPVGWFTVPPGNVSVTCHTPNDAHAHLIVAKGAPLSHLATLVWMIVGGVVLLAGVGILVGGVVSARWRRRMEAPPAA
jgi:hypothetical protein